MISSQHTWGPYPADRNQITITLVWMMVQTQPRDAGTRCWRVSQTLLVITVSSD